MLSGSVIIPREKITQLEDRPELAGLFMMLLIRARYRAGPGHGGVMLEEGQLVCGKSYLASISRCSESKCYRALKSLEKRNLIELSTERRPTVVTIRDWESYARLPSRERTEGGPASARHRTSPAPKPKRQRTQNKEEGRSQEQRKEPPPPKSPPGGVADTGPVEVWREVEDALRLEGVSCVRQAVQEARVRGLTAEEALRYVREYRGRPGAYDAGALYRRLTGELEDWPAPREGYRAPIDEALAAETKRLNTVRCAIIGEWERAYRSLPRRHVELLRQTVKEQFPGLRNGHVDVAAMELLSRDPSRWLVAEVNCA